MAEETYQESLKEQAEHLEQEARMVVPGVQALLGFQFVAVLNERFKELSWTEQHLHWLALLFVAGAAAFVMAPAAYHRKAEPRRISASFVNQASHWVEYSMRFLALGIAGDVYVVGRIVTDDTLASLAGAVLVLSLFVGLWYVYPAYRRRQLKAT